MNLIEKEEQAFYNSIEALFTNLEAEPLDRVFEAYGNFIEADPLNMDGEALLSPGGVIFSGNFFNLSAVFDIREEAARLERDRKKDVEDERRLKAELAGIQRRKSEAA